MAKAHQPIDPLRMRIFSELNLQLGHHGIEKETMNETSKHLAFLSRYYLNTPSPDPLRISVPIIDVPLIGPAGDVIMAHQIALVVQSSSPSLPSSSPPNTTSVPTARNPAGVRQTPCLPSPSPFPSSTTTKPRLRVLIQMHGTLGHRNCLIDSFTAVAERVISGLLVEDEGMVSALEVKKKSGKGKKDGGRLRPVWDVDPWGDW